MLNRIETGIKPQHKVNTVGTDTEINPGRRAGFAHPKRDGQEIARPRSSVDEYLRMQHEQGPFPCATRTNVEPFVRQIMDRRAQRSTDTKAKGGVE